MGTKKTLKRATITDLKRWWCILNVWEWPDDLDMPKPTKERLRDDPNHSAAWRAVNERLSARRISEKEILSYWNGVFLPTRKL